MPCRDGRVLVEVSGLPGLRVGLRVRGQRRQSVLGVDNETRVVIGGARREVCCQGCTVRVTLSVVGTRAMRLAAEMVTIACKRRQQQCCYCCRMNGSAGMFMESARSAQGGPHYWARGRTDALLTLHTRTAARLGAFDRANALYLQFALHDYIAAHMPLWSA